MTSFAILYTSIRKNKCKLANFLMNIRIWYVKGIILSLNVKYYEKYNIVNQRKVTLSFLFDLLNNQECSIFIYQKLTNEILYFFDLLFSESCQQMREKIVL